MFLEESANNNSDNSWFEVKNIFHKLPSIVPLQFCCFFDMRSELLQPLIVEGAKLLHVTALVLELAQRQLEFSVEHLIIV